MNNVVNVLFGEMVSNISTPFAVCDLLKVFLFFIIIIIFLSMIVNLDQPSGGYLIKTSERSARTASLGRVCFKYETEEKTKFKQRCCKLK